MAISSYIVIFYYCTIVLLYYSIYFQMYDLHKGHHVVYHVILKTH